MNRRSLLRHAAGATALVVGATALDRRALAARQATPPADPTALDLPEVTIAVDDTGFAVPAATAAGRTLLTIQNTGTKQLHFFAARIPDEVGDADLASSLATPDAEPAWFDMTTLTMLGNPDWPAPGGRAQGVVEVGAGRWLLVDPIDGREVALWNVAEGASGASEPEPTADLEVAMVEMDFAGLDLPVCAGRRLWKIVNRGALEHEIALLEVSPGSTKEGVIQTLSDMLQGQGDPGRFAPVGGQGIASKGVTSWQLFDLTPGTYAAVCMSPMPGEDFMPHALMGMVKVFTAR